MRKGSPNNKRRLFALHFGLNPSRFATSCLPENSATMRAGLGPKRSARGKTKPLVLPRPFHWQVGEASNAQAVRQPAIDCGLDEIGGEQSQRDCHVDLSRAAVLPLCYALRIWFLLLQVNGLIMPGLVELSTPHFVHALVIGATERHGRPEPNVEIAEIFESALPVSRCRAGGHYVVSPRSRRWRQHSLRVRRSPAPAQGSIWRAQICSRGPTMSGHRPLARPASR
jgi:hypothetical protein